MRLEDIQKMCGNLNNGLNNNAERSMRILIDSQREMEKYVGRNARDIVEQQKNNLLASRQSLGYVDSLAKRANDVLKDTAIQNNSLRDAQSLAYRNEQNLHRQIQNQANDELNKIKSLAYSATDALKESSRIAEMHSKALKDSLGMASKNAITLQDQIIKRANNELKRISGLGLSATDLMQDSLRITDLHKNALQDASKLAFDRENAIARQFKNLANENIINTENLRQKTFENSQNSIFQNEQNIYLQIKKQAEIEARIHRGYGRNLAEEMQLDLLSSTSRAEKFMADIVKSQKLEIERELHSRTLYETNLRYERDISYSPMDYSDIHPSRVETPTENKQVNFAQIKIDDLLAEKEGYEGELAFGRFLNLYVVMGKREILAETLQALDFNTIKVEGVDENGKFIIAKPTVTEFSYFFEEVEIPQDKFKIIH